MLPAPAAEADAAREGREVAEAVGARRRRLKEFDDERRLLRVWCDPFGRPHVPVAQGCPRRPPAVTCFLVHAFLHLFTQVLDVVLCHEHAHAREEAHARMSLGVEDGAFFDEVDREAEAFQCAIVLKVPREPIDLLHDQRAHLGVVAEEREHLAESRAPGAFGGLVVAELDDEL